MSGLDEKGMKAACDAYDETQMVNGATLWVLNETECLEAAITAYLASVTPADVGEEPVAELIAEGRKRSGVVDNYEGKNYLIRRLTDALERVVMDRDEARATLDEVCLSSRQEWQRAESAEAKLAEARKVIEPFAKAAGYGVRMISEREASNLPRDYARAVFASAEQTGWDPWDAARRWTEETK